MLRRSNQQLLTLLTEAEELGFVHKAKGGWALTNAGEEFGGLMSKAVEETRQQARRVYRPFHDYVPDSWHLEP
jgi:hypothetical protein